MTACAAASIPASGAPLDRRGEPGLGRPPGRVDDPDHVLVRRAADERALVLDAQAVEPDVADRDRDGIVENPGAGLGAVAVRRGAGRPAQRHETENLEILARNMTGRFHAHLGRERVVQLLQQPSRPDFLGVAAHRPIGECRTGAHGRDLLRVLDQPRLAQRDSDIDEFQVGQARVRLLERPAHGLDAHARVGQAEIAQNLDEEVRKLKHERAASALARLLRIELGSVEPERSARLLRAQPRTRNIRDDGNHRPLFRDDHQERSLPRLDRHRVVGRELEEVGAGKDERRNTRALHDRREPQAAVIANRKT
jgi:hypothetical protein